MKFQASIQTLLGLQRFQISGLYQDFSGMRTRFQVRPGKLDLLFRISHLLDLLANAVWTWQIYSATPAKSGRGIVWKAIMTWGGRSQRKRALMWNNKSSLSCRRLSYASLTTGPKSTLVLEIWLGDQTVFFSWKGDVWARDERLRDLISTMCNLVLLKILKIMTLQSEIYRL